MKKKRAIFEWNYDDSLLIPTILPSQFPNILINGSAGIAVGMASNIPPHNLEEVVSTCIRLLDQDLSLDEIIQFIPGPDFPTAGTILGRAGLIQAYKTGRGSVVMRAVVEIEEQGGREQIIVKELPYQVNKAHLIENMAGLVRDKKLEGISDIRDESSREGMRIVILVKRKENAQVLLNKLYKQTKLQSSFGMHLLALDREGQPRTFSIKDILLAFLAHRRDVVTRRLVFDLNKAQEKLHILEGLATALDHLDEVISLIRESKETAQAKQELMSRFQLSVIQAQSILDLRLQKLTGMERQKVIDERNELREYIKKTKAILADPKAIDDIIRKELEKIKERFSRPRKTQIEDVENDFTDKDLVTEEDIVVVVTSDSKVKRILLEEYRVQKRGGTGVKGSGLGVDEEWVWKTLCATTHTTFVVLTNKSKLFHLDAFKIPEGSRFSKGKSIRNLLMFDSGEHICSIVPVEDFSDRNLNLFMASEKGIFKKTKLSLFSRSWQKGITALSVKEGDQLTGAVLSSPENDILAVSEKGMGIRFKDTDIRSMGRTARGVKGMKLKNEDKIKGVYAIDKNEKQSLFTVSKNGYGKITDLNSLRVTRRGGQGVRIHKFTERTGFGLSGALLVYPYQQILLVTNKGQTIRFSCQELSQKGRHTQGVRLMRLKEGEYITGISQINEMDQTVEQSLDQLPEDTGITNIQQYANGSISAENKEKESEGDKKE